MLFFLDDWCNLQSNTRSIEPPGPSVTPLPDMIDTSSLQSGLINTGSIYNEPLGSAASYLYSSEVLYTPNPSSSMEKSTTAIDTITPILSKDNGDEGLQFTASSSGRRKESGKRSLNDAKDVLDASIPKKIIVKEVDKTSQFFNDVYLQKSEANREVNVAMAAEQSGHTTRSSSNFETLLSNAIDISANQNTPSRQTKTAEGIAARDLPNRALESKGMSIDTVEEIISVDSQFSQRKMFVNQIATTKVVEYSELPPQLQAPNLTAHLQAVMSTRNANAAMPRNKSDTQLSSLADKFASPQSLKVTKKEVSPLVKSKGPNSTLPRNMSDSNLVQMAKDTCRVYTRRRMASISVDSKPLILPRNFSDSNLCSLGRGLPRRPQPILPKSLIGIVPPSQSRGSSTIPKVGASQVETISGQTATVGTGQYSSFVVNKQRPSNPDPVQVTLYMPKGKKTAQIPAVPKEDITVSKQGNLPPQRVEVIQYKGHTSAEQGHKVVGIVPAVAVAPTISNIGLQPSSVLQRSLQSVPTHRDSVGTSQHTTNVIHHETLVASKEPFHFTAPVTYQSRVPHATVTDAMPVATLPIPSLLQRNRSSDVSNTIQNSGSNIGNVTLPALNVQGSTAAPTQIPVVAPGDEKAESIAPLQGLSDQQLVSLAHILRGSRSGDIGQETTIAFLEMLQKQLNTLLEQQQGRMTTQQVTTENLLTTPMNTSKLATANNQGPERALTFPYVTLTSTNLASAPLPSVALPTSALPSVSLASTGQNCSSATWPQKFDAANIVVGSSLAQSSAGMVPREKTHLKTEIPMQQVQTPEASSVSQNILKEMMMSHTQTQSAEVTGQKLNVGNRNDIPSQIYTAASEPPFVKISDVSNFTRGQHSVPQQSVPGTGMNASVLQQGLPVPSTTMSFVEVGPQLAQKASAQLQSKHQMNIQQPILLNVNSGSLASTVDTSLITLSVIPPLNPTQSTVLVSLGAPLSSQPSAVTLAGADADDKQKTSGTSVRPTMVDLAIAASQRTYLADVSSVQAGTSQGNAPAGAKMSVPMVRVHLSGFD